MSTSSALAQSIHKTLSYFDILNFPLTSEELFRYLWVPPRLGYEEFVVSLRGSIDEVLTKQSPKFQSRVNQGFQYFFLPGRESLIEERKKAANVTEQKLKKARRAAKFIRAVPFLRAIFVCNSVGAQMSTSESDIDFFIIAARNRIWIVRFFSNLILLCCGLRTYGKRQRDKICLSFYVDTMHLDLWPLRAKDDDIHFAYWLNMMVPVFDPENYHAKFLQANKWVERFLPNLSFRASLAVTRNLCPSFGEPEISHGVYTEWSECVRNDNQKVPIGILGRAWKKMWEVMWRGAYGNMIENETKKIQLSKMKLSLKEKAKLPDHGIVIEEGVIKLHENDTRLAIRQKWLAKN